MSPPDPVRMLGAVPSPRRRFVASSQVRVAQGALLARVALLLVLLATLPVGAAPRLVADARTLGLPLVGQLSATALGPWVVALCLVEAALVHRLGRLGGASRRLVVLIEFVVMVAAVLDAVAGGRAALVLLPPAAVAVVVLRLAPVRHDFAVAALARRPPSSRVRPLLFEGYRPPDTAGAPPRQLVGYRVSEATAGASADRSTS